MPSRPGQCRPRPNSLSSSPQPRSPGSPHHQDARGPPRPRTPPSASSSWSSSSGRRQAPPVGEGPPSRATRGTPRPDQVPASSPWRRPRSAEGQVGGSAGLGRPEGPVRAQRGGRRQAARGLPGRRGAARPLRAPGRGRQRLRPYHPERARSRLISEAKQGRAWLVLGWETAWEYRVL